MRTPNLEVTYSESPLAWVATVGGGNRNFQWCVHLSTVQPSAPTVCCECMGVCMCVSVCMCVHMCACVILHV